MKDETMSIEEVAAMTDEQVTLHLARAGISPSDMDAMWERSVEKWANDPDPIVQAFGREQRERLRESMRGGGR